MSSRIGFLVVGLALIASVGFALYAMETSRTAQQEAAELRKALQEAEARVAQPTPEVAKPGGEEDRAPSPIEDTDHASVPAEVDTAALIEQLMEQMDVQSDGDAGESSPNSGSMQFKFDEKMVSAQAKMQTNMQYNAFFRESDLSAADRQTVREILETYASEELGRYLLADEDGAETRLSPEELEAWRDEALRDVMGVDEFENFLAYEETKDVRMLEESFELQLRMQSPGLSPEVRDYVRDLVVAEMLIIQAEAVENYQQGNESRMGELFSMEALEERLQAELSPEDFREVQPFFEQQRALSEMMQASGPVHVMEMDAH